MPAVAKRRLLLQIAKDAGYEGRCLLAEPPSAAPSFPPDPRFDGFDAKTDEEKLAVLKTVGEEVYLAHCAACHQTSGEGIPSVFPPLKGDPLLLSEEPQRPLVSVLLKGQADQVINGVSYAAAMAPFAGQLSDQQVAAVATWVRKAWGHDARVVLPSHVAEVRAR